MPDNKPAAPDKTTGVIGNPTSYANLLPSGGVYAPDGDTNYNNNDPAGYLHLGNTYGHPGKSADAAGRQDRYVIAAYTVAQNGYYKISNSYIRKNSGNGSGLRLIVHVDSASPALDIKPAPTVQQPFDVHLGYLNTGSTVYVAIGPDGNADYDSFSLDFSIEKYESSSWSDPDLTDSGKRLWSRLRSLSRQDRFAFGHQDAILYGINSNYDNSTWSVYNNANQDRSDVKSMTGRHPMVLGFDVALPDTPWLGMDGLRRRVQDAHRWGGIITFSWHRTTIWYNGQWIEPTLASVQPGGIHHAALLAHLDELATWMKTLTDDNGRPIPFIFRPWHEFSGWFWWYADNTSQAQSQFITLYRLTVDRLRNAGCRSVLTAFSPCGHRLGVDRDFFFAYPGDSYVDIYAVDEYFAADRDFQDQGGPMSVNNKATAGAAQFWNAVNIVAQAVRSKETQGIEKLMAIAEFGAPQGIWSNQQNITNYTAAHYFKELFLDGLVANVPLENRKRITYALTWRNGSKTHGWVPVANHAGAQDFLAFAEDPHVMLLEKAGDFNRDQSVNLCDFAILASQWQETAGDPSADLMPYILDGRIDQQDLSVFCGLWLQ